MNNEEYYYQQMANAENVANILGLSEERIEELKNIPIENVELDYENIRNEFAIINIDEIAGICRTDTATNWYELLGTLHKGRTINQCNNNNFHEFLNRKQDSGLPEVIEYKNKYYIAGDGKHRLTIARCKNEPTAAVALKRIK